MTDLENNLLAFYQFNKRAGNYPVTEAVERWISMHSPEQEDRPKTRPDPSTPAPGAAPSGVKP